jgi:hypothetical protein
MLERIKIDERTKTVYFKRSDFGADSARDAGSSTSGAEDKKIKRLVQDTSQLYKVSYLYENEQPSSNTARSNNSD